MSAREDREALARWERLWMDPDWDPVKGYPSREKQGEPFHHKDKPDRGTKK